MPMPNGAPSRAAKEECPIDASGGIVGWNEGQRTVRVETALLYYSPQFVRMITEKMMTFALGRGVEYYDMPVIRSIVRDSGEEQLPVFFVW